MYSLTKPVLLGAVQEGLERWTASYDDQLEKWARSVDPAGFFGYSPFGLPISCAFAAGFLYSLEGDEEKARVARAHLVDYRQFLRYYPKDYPKARREYRAGVPPVTNIFTLWQYVKAYQWIRGSACLTPADHRAIESIVADSAAGMMHFPEWGAHNRAMLRALCLSFCAQTLPRNPAARGWGRVARALADDSLKHWNIEDAMLYHAVWAHALIWYADVNQVPDFFKHPTTRYYFEYFKQLLAPSGGLADFGDSDWQSNAVLYVACLARAAKEYRDPELKFAAETLFGTVCERSGGPPAGDAAISTYLWLDDGVEARMPTSGSGDVLDELVGKKIVFRSGWEPRSTFLLLNYKPETDFGVTQREFLKNTISVEAEKAHHGHSDENAICLLVHDGSVLLHDGGYREQLPNGKYRADYYHNRLVFREKELVPETPIMDFLEYDGKHHPMDTVKVDFQSFEEVEMSRTRVTDRSARYAWDRGVVYLKRKGWFVLFDGVTLLRQGRTRRERTVSLSNLFFTGEILGRGDTYFDTRITKLREIEVPDNAHLLVGFPQAGRQGFWIGSQQTRRYYQDEIVVHQSRCASLDPGQYVAFVTVLAPHRRGADVGKALRAITIPQVDRYPEAVALEISEAGQKTTVGMKLNLDSEVLARNVRPRYDWESGRTVYGAVETDARFFYCRQSGSRLSYAFTEAVRFAYRGQEIFSAPAVSFPLQYVGAGTQVGTPKWRALEGTTRIPQ